MPIYRIERSGLTVVLVGHEACDPYIIHLLYDEYVNPERVGTVPVWSLNRVIRHWEKTADVIIFRHRKFSPGGGVSSRMLVMPYYVAQTVELPPSDANLRAVFHNSATNGDLSRIRIAEFQYEITQDAAQLDFFYHQMHRPFTLDRHRDAARISPWPAFRRDNEKMELLLIRKEGMPIAGTLNLQTGDCYTNHVNGVLNADKELLRAGAVAALYWFTIVEAHRRGCATVNLNCARPFLKNGVLAYKKKWGSRVVMDHRERELWLLPCGNRPPMQRFFEDNPFICERDGQLVSLIFLGSHTVLNDKELATYLKSCSFQGKHLSTCIVFLSKEWAARAETIQAILRSLPQPSRTLDLSQASLADLPEIIHNRQDEQVSHHGAGS